MNNTNIPLSGWLGHAKYLLRQQVLAPMLVLAATVWPIPASAWFDSLPIPLPGAGISERSANLGRVMELEATGNLAAALALAEKQVKEDSEPRFRLSSLAPGNQMLQQSASMAASLNLRAGNYPRAIELYKLVLSAAPKLPIPNAAFSARTSLPIHLELGKAYELAGDDRNARDVYASLLPGLAELGEAGSLERLPVLVRLGELESRAGNSGPAEQHLVAAVRESLEMARKSKSSATGVGFMDAVNSLRNAGSIAESALKDINKEMTLADSEGRTLSSQPGLAWADMASMNTRAFSSLVALYFRTGAREKLQNLYWNEFKAYEKLAAKEDSTIDLARGNVDLEKGYALFAGYFSDMGLGKEAEDAFESALRLNATRLENIATQFDPEIVWELFTLRRRMVGMYISHLLARKDAPPGLRDVVLGRMIDSKGIGNELIAMRNRAILLSDDDELRQLQRRLEELELQSLSAPNGSKNDYIRQSESFAQRKNIRIAMHERVKKALPPVRFEDGSRAVGKIQERLGGDTLVGFMVYEPFDFTSQRYREPRYVGYRVGGGNPPLLVDIGPASEIDGLVSRYRIEMANGAKGQSARGDGELRRLAQALYGQLLRPLLAGRVKATGVAIDGDGALNLLPFEALVDDSGRYLIEAARWRYLTSARALLRPVPSPSGKNTALVMGNPDFGDGARENRPVEIAAGPVPENVKVRGQSLRGMKFGRLPETADEARTVASILRNRFGSKETVLTDAMASEEELGKADSPRFLHIATHGFFSEGAGSKSFSLEAAKGESVSAYLVMDGFTAGLALAGANDSLASGGSRGVYFLSKMRRLNIQGTELAVLSACDTGNGIVDVGEGINSLRRALELGGAQSSLTSLWPVPSLETKGLMGQFYEALAQGERKSEALRRAKLTVMKNSPHPFYWAAFVLAGEDAASMKSNPVR